MKLIFPLLLKNGGLQIISPDFKIDLVKNLTSNNGKASAAVATDNNINSDNKKIVMGIGKLTEILENFMSDLIQDGYTFDYPKELSFYQSYYAIDNNDLWTSVEIDVAIEKSFFETALPVFAVGIRIVNAMSFAVVTFLSLYALSDEKDDTHTGLSISGAFFGIIMSIVIFYYSNAMEHMAQLGRNLDTCKKKKFQSKDTETIKTLDTMRSIVSEQSFEHQRKKHPIRTYGIFSAYGLIALGDILITSNVRYQSTLALNKGRGNVTNSSSSEEAVLPHSVVMTTALALAFSHLLTDLIFEGSFAFKASTHAVQLLSRFSFLNRSRTDGSERGEKAKLISSPEESSDESIIIKPS